jgi:hypothetical protein
LDQKDINQYLMKKESDIDISKLNDKSLKIDIGQRKTIDFDKKHV